MLNPRPRGARRIHSPYLSTKYWTTRSGGSPAASRSRMMPRIWFAISEGESATERFWQTTHRSCAATSRTASAFTVPADPGRCCAKAAVGLCALAANPPRPVDEERFRHAVDSVVDRNLAVRVGRVRKGEVEVRDELLRRLLLVLDRDADKGDAPTAIRAPGPLERRRFVVAS